MRYVVLTLSLLGVAAYAFLGWDVGRQLMRLEEHNARPPVVANSPAMPAWARDSETYQKVLEAEKKVQENNEQLTRYKQRIQRLLVLLCPAVLMILGTGVLVFSRVMPGWLGANVLLLPPAVLAVIDFDPMVLLFGSPVILAGLLSVFVRRPHRPAELAPENTGPARARCASCTTELPGTLYTTKCCARSVCEPCYQAYCRTVVERSKLSGVKKCLFCPHVIDDMKK